MTLVEKLTIGTILLVVGATIGTPVLKLTGVPISYSDGDRTGVVYKISKKGLFFKTWEGELNVGGMSTDGNGVAVPNRWAFSVPDEAVAKDLLEASRTGQRITLHYTQPLVVAHSQGSTGYLVTSVQR